MSKIQLGCNIKSIDQDIHLKGPGHTRCLSTHTDGIPQRQSDTPREIVDPVHSHALLDHEAEHLVGYRRIDGSCRQLSVQVKDECEVR